MLVHLAITVLAALAAFATTALIRRNAHRLGIVQSPNARSSHTQPTPSGGGVGIVLGGTIATALAAFAAPGPWVIILLVALATAVIGFVDDRHPLPAAVRLVAQLVLTGLALWFGLSVTDVVREIGLPLPTLLVGAIALVVVVYWINLFNFMDGIDGIAASQAIFMCCAAAVLAVLHVTSSADAPLFWVLIGVAAASAGFLLLNWPPAKIFMGDAGSTYLGMIIALLALASVAAGWISLPQWIILAAAFVVDATVTLIRRLMQRERVFEAHRRHAYQVLSRRWGGHKTVTLTFIAVNLLWLLPLAFAAGVTSWGWALVALAYLPLVLLAIWAGAGAPEQPAPTKL